MELVRINENDNVEVSLSDGHKYAARDIKKGEKVVKYGFPIGNACEDIKKGALVHTHNLRTALGGKREYEYSPEAFSTQFVQPREIDVFYRKNGDIGIRNDIWIIPTVGCVNSLASRIASITGALAFTHPYGCSQLGDDLEYTRKTLRGLILHPNAGGVLVLGLGCENNRISELKSFLGDFDEDRIRFLNAQEASDEISEGVAAVNSLKALAMGDKRKKAPVSKLRLGLKCGGSDGFSGITANPMAGRVSDMLVSMGGACVLTEVPEMFGAEEILFRRCSDEEVFNKAVDMINGFKGYYISHGQPVSENPSPGNRDGGITTLEEKSLGCVQKGGLSPVTDVLGFCERIKKPGLSLLAGPGNDIVSCTALTAAGCHMILFTTGRGTPLGAPVPTLKIASNAALACRKSGWIDYDASSGDENGLFSLLLDTANGAPTKNEINACREIAIFKDGVTL